MQYFELLCHSLEYIECHLFEKDLIKNIHAEFHVSRYHFHRLFLLGTKYTLGEYVKRRRFTVISERISEGEGVLTVAIDCNYNSHEALTRAFKSFFGITPSKFKKSMHSNPLLTQERLTVDELHYLYTELDVHPQIKVVEKTEVWGIQGETDFVNNEIGSYWEKLITLTGIQKTNTSADKGYTLWLSDNKDARILHETSMYPFFVGVNHYSEGSELRQQVIPQGLYACFSLTNGFQFIYQTYAYIYFVWLRKNAYRLGDGVVFEEYSADFSLSENRGEMKIYVPIKQ
ncbi:AraC family transcriptional regulator [Reinekea sp. G2M2-21]|uniref:AraC family transcriptional regulator n=1 Tax=Reinekea sp. G2M2-21 TaxID=2788942 RepID=UPI0018A99F0E|nr:AraC family transcriptional regulator [Reinekea sp. G2M2-21]